MIENKFIKCIKDFNLIEKNEKVLIAISGGVDSVVLTHLFVKFKNYLNISEIVLAHLNHKLRGKDSYKDEIFCINLAKNLGLKIYTKRLDIRKISKQEKSSIEEIGRRERYKFLNYIAKKLNIEKIATAHHLSDLAETMVLWFIQGNRKGLKGFRPKEKNIIRPMLYVKKEEIENYAKENNIDYRLDITNLSTEYLRNKIRHNIIPALKDINKNLENSLFRLSYFLDLDEQFLEEESDKLMNIFSDIKLDLKQLKIYPKAILYRFFQKWIYQNTGIYPSYLQIYQILNILEKYGTKKIKLDKETEIIKEYDFLYLKKVEKAEKFYYQIKIGDEIFIKEHNFYIKSFKAESIDIDKMKDEKRVVCFDIDEENPVFEIRTRQEGDRFLPFGRKTEKKLKDILIDMKIPKAIREKIPILVYNNKILWIIGYKRSGYFPVKENSKNVICFEIKEV